jgi:low affinity Fe/Cu permease
MSSGRFTRFSSIVARSTGSGWTFAAATVLLGVWLALGPVFHWSGRWQLVASTSTTVITFLMVFVIQATQNRNSASMQLKLDELIRANDNARTRLVGADDMTEPEIQEHRDALRRGRE